MSVKQLRYYFKIYIMCKNMSSKGSLPHPPSVEAIKGCQNVLQNDKHWKDNII